MSDQNINIKILEKARSEVEKVLSANGVTLCKDEKSGNICVELLTRDENGKLIYMKTEIENVPF